MKDKADENKTNKGKKAPHIKYVPHSFFFSYMTNLYLFSFRKTSVLRAQEDMAADQAGPAAKQTKYVTDSIY